MNSNNCRKSQIFIEVLDKLGPFIDKKVTFNEILENILSLASKTNQPNLVELA
jgi:hypothetical protein